MDETEKLKKAAALIEEMTDGRQTVCSGVGGYIRTAEDANFGLQMRWNPHFEQERYQITFEVYSRQMGAAMDSHALAGLLEEAGQLHALMTALEMQEFHPSQQEYQAFFNKLEQEQEAAPMMGQTF